MKSNEGGHLREGLCLRQLNVLMEANSKRRADRAAMQEWEMPRGRCTMGSATLFSKLLYLELLSPDFTPPISGDSATRDGLPGASQAKNTDSITPRHTRGPDRGAGFWSGDHCF